MQPQTPADRIRATLAEIRQLKDQQAQCREELSILVKDFTDKKNELLAVLQAASMSASSPSAPISTKPVLQAAKFVTVVTGANRGLGKAMCQQLAQKDWGALCPTSRGGVDENRDGNVVVVVVIMVGRDCGKIHAARDEIVAGCGATNATSGSASTVNCGTVPRVVVNGSGGMPGVMAQDYGTGPVVVVVVDSLAMDIGDPESVTQGANSVKQKWGRVDLLINNAGIAPHDPSDVSGLEVSAKAAIDVFNINVHGVLRTMDAFIPMMDHATPSSLLPMPHIVNVSSKGVGKFLAQCSPDVQSHVTSVYDIPSITSLMEEYVSLLSKGKEHTAAQGWATYIYGLSKVLVTLITKIYATKYPSILITSVHPGTCNTDIIPASWHSFLNLEDPSFGANVILKQAFTATETGVFLDEFGLPLPCGV
ncbi:carbonyl reductase 1 [Pelomyxa schiedti]|nr:carbonyl reductase 1 [Pelomyxa schiedti]